MGWDDALGGPLTVNGFFQAARERRRQIGHQLPLYDVDATKRCERLPPKELQSFERYLEELRTRVAGQGEIVPLRGHTAPLPPPSENLLNNNVDQLAPDLKALSLSPQPKVRGFDSRPKRNKRLPMRKPAKMD